MELVLQANASLLPRGVPSIRPADLPVALREYDVRFLDADAFLWRPDLIRAPAENRLEAHVMFQTDEFGFRNPPGLPGQVFAVILGRSFSLGAQVNAPWPSLLGSATRQSVLNLAQSGPSLSKRLTTMAIYGVPRHPRWTLVDVMPALDILNGQPIALPLLPPLLAVFILFIPQEIVQSNAWPPVLPPSCPLPPSRQSSR
ncbi:MAG: hypothetical protein HYZ26_06565 [Chloroflexi bacterium]|nr:hypothetical protein [Chloroflexota bacterium]